MIDIYSFTWEAFATLITGLAAVAGATFVGLRQINISESQVKIADKQSLILKKQVDLDELKFRADLFEKRFAVYEATRNILIQALEGSKRPANDDKRQMNFLIAKDQATFLFRPSVGDDLQIIWIKICASQAVRAEMDGNFARDGTYGDGLIEKDLEHSLWHSERLKTLSDIFGDELKLTQRASEA